MEPIRIFIASTPAEWLPARVLEFSIRETTQAAVNVAQLHTFNRPIRTPAAVKNQPRTPFSFQRFLIPELCDHRGKAIYLDADMQIFCDIIDLWSHPMNGCVLQSVAEGKTGRRGQFSVMLLDCAELAWDVDAIVESLDKGVINYGQLMHEMCVASRIGRDIPPAWNSLEHYHAGHTALVHYTDMNIQPWVDCKNPLAGLWVAGLRQALLKGFISHEEVQSEVEARHVRPSLLEQLDSGIDDPMMLTKAQRDLDLGFVAPYHGLPSGRSKPWIFSATALKLRLAKIAHRLRCISLNQRP